MSIEYDYQKGLFAVDDLRRCSQSEMFLAVNWNITGQCNNSCVYCFGHDILSLAVDDITVNAISQQLVNLSPNLIVLSGGEPLLCNYVDRVIETISHKSKVILDTNGLLLTYDMLVFLKQKNVHIRISLDSCDCQLNEQMRPSSVPNSTQAIFQKITWMNEIGLPYTLQTTVTSHNINYLDNLARFIQLHGIKNWRLSAVVPHTEVFGNELLKKFNCLQNDYPDIFIRISNIKDSDGYNIVLVNPIGNFYVRNTISNTKKLICRDCTFPHYEDIVKHIDNFEHLKRYSIEK